MRSDGERRCAPQTALDSRKAPTSRGFPGAGDRGVEPRVAVLETPVFAAFWPVNTGLYCGDGIRARDETTVGMSQRLHHPADRDEAIAANEFGDAPQRQVRGSPMSRPIRGSTTASARA